jgi:glycosyltransferase involved in cell wall biosynthesis
VIAGEDAHEKTGPAAAFEPARRHSAVPHAKAWAAPPVARVLHVFPDFVAAGPELRSVALIDAFGPQLAHTIVSLGGHSGAAGSLPPAARVEILRAEAKAGTAVTARRLRRLLATGSPDLVLSYNWAGIDMVLAAASLRYRHLVHHEDGFDADEARRFKLRRVWARRLALRAAQRVIVPSATLERIARERWHIPARRLALIPNGIHVDRFPLADGNGELRRRLGFPAGTFVIGAVGHLRPEKAFERLIRAVAAVPAARLVIVGDGAERQRLQAIAEDVAPGRVHFAGHQGDPRPWLRCLDAFALSSTTEQLPVSLLEAMACSLPVVATDVGDVAATLPAAQRSLVVTVQGDGVVEALRDALRSLAGDSSLRRALGVANRAQVAQRFTFERMAASYAEVYRAGLSPEVAARWQATT